MFHNEDTTWNIDQIPGRIDVMSIFLDFIFRDFLNYKDNSVYTYIGLIKCKIVNLFVGGLGY
jgi:hypothetical protein